MRRIRTVLHYLDSFYHYLKLWSFLRLGYVLWLFLFRLQNLYNGLSCYVDMTVECWVEKMIKMCCCYRQNKVLLQIPKVLYGTSRFFNKLQVSNQSIFNQRKWGFIARKVTRYINFIFPFYVFYCNLLSMSAFFQIFQKKRNRVLRGMFWIHISKELYF